MSFGQQAADSIPPAQESQGSASPSMDAADSRQKLRFNLEFGTTFGGSRYGSYFGTYVSPRFTYPVSNRVTVSAGGYFYGLSPMHQAEQPVSGGFPAGGLYSRSLIYVEGAYHLNEDITLTGTAYKEINPFGQQSPYPGYNPETRGFIMGVHYKISDHVFIHGEVEVSNGYNPFRTNSLMNPAGNRFGDPFYYGR